MNFWNNLFLSGIRNFPYGAIELEWPNGKVEKISASKAGPKANLKIVDDNVVREIITGGSVKFAELFMSKRLSSSNLTTLNLQWIPWIEVVPGTRTGRVQVGYYWGKNNMKNKKSRKDSSSYCCCPSTTLPALVP